MEEQKPRIQSPQPFHQPLAWQPYSENENEPVSLEDDKVVPMRIQNTITEDQLRPDTPSKRKPRSATEGKTRAAATVRKKPFKTAWQTQSMQQQYTDELQRLEDHAKRLNQIIAEQSNKNAIRETLPVEIADASLPNSADPPTIPKASTPTERQIAQRSPHIQPIKNQWQSPTSVQEQPIEALKLEALKSQEHSIHQRLVELGLYLNEAGALIPFSEEPSASEKGNHPHRQSSIPQPPAPAAPLSYSPTQTWESSSSDPWDQEPYTAKTDTAKTDTAKTDTAKTDTARTEDSYNWDRETALNQDLPRDRPRSRSSPLPTTLRRYLREWRGRWRDSRSLDLPRKPIDRISDAALWMAISMVMRVTSRYVIAAFPMLSPIFLVLMLAPAIAAMYLVFCVPKAGWIPYYRLFLIMVGFFVGGKL